MKKTKTDYWKRCDVNTLAGHFHKFNDKSQYERIGALYLHEDELETLFLPNQDNVVISSFDVLMGLDSPVSLPDSYTFSPIISVSNSANPKPVEHTFKFDAPPVPYLSEEVPLLFKDWLSKNWMELDSSLIDDVFTASFEDDTDENIVQADKKKGLPIMRNNQRLLGYHFTKDKNQSFLKFINDHRKDLRQFVFHLGVDMNKSKHKELFNFSPVFEIHLSNVSEGEIREIRKSGLRCIPGKNQNDEVVYFEYMMPCPSTCPSE